MTKYIVIAGAPSLRDIRSDDLSSTPRWRTIRPSDSSNTSIDAGQGSNSYSYGLPSGDEPSGDEPSGIVWPTSQSQFPSQSSTQPESFLEAPTRIDPQTTRNDSITSTSTASTVLENETFPTRTFRMTNTLPASQSQSQSSSSSSVANFPTFHFSLRSLTPLRVALTSVGRGSVRANLLVAVMEVDGPDSLTTKAGQETHLLKLVIGDDEGAVGKISVWGETALEWGGAKKMMGLRRGDVVFLSDVQVTCVPPEKPTLSASPRYNSGIQLCYRTSVRTDEDRRLQPDLRLGQTDACVRRVATFVEWVERVV